MEYISADFGVRHVRMELLVELELGGQDGVRLHLFAAVDSHLV